MERNEELSKAEEPIEATDLVEERIVQTPSSDPGSPAPSPEGSHPGVN